MRGRRSLCTFLPKALSFYISKCRYFSFCHFYSPLRTARFLRIRQIKPFSNTRQTEEEHVPFFFFFLKFQHSFISEDTSPTAGFAPSAAHLRCLIWRRATDLFADKIWIFQFIARYEGPTDHRLHIRYRKNNPNLKLVLKKSTPD